MERVCDVNVPVKTRHKHKHAEKNVKKQINIRVIDTEAFRNRLLLISRVDLDPSGKVNEIKELGRRAIALNRTLHNVSMR
ncbi:hypothetical protein MAR_014486 [Mya arenaria]|uniref:Uncharacterized protein n=1 Tax=Mya arenaria TaxID=6604 RepID=A0ABY7G648_MYAAR|nr:hypothetical protein MAR_014486 [Mya arenaria]